MNPPPLLPCSSKLSTGVVFTLKHLIRRLKLLTRVLSFLCTLTILLLSSITFSIYLSTRNLPPIATSTAWHPHTILWPSILIFVLAVISFIVSGAVLLAYYLRGHGAAERVGLYSTAMAVGAIIVAVAVWAVVGGVFLGSKDTKTGRDLWGWACARETEGQRVRRERFGEKVKYGVVCGLMDWNFVCAMIQVVAETAAVVVYVLGAWRVWRRSKLSGEVVG
ncbi:hypothetical protein EX30DRAFT_367529 [Ascodesmis nigricans]|uniref:MARVEL domain-containing protein n=1 Tax=Ascodesmis nigricans TaxID=341454 RepID=A0A4S2MHB9_9PEZI|nr:hypothetical protein EX30DRAFT_367529 [Ascodesmis nigricans]